jgi:cytochrome c peroxidase
MRMLIGLVAAALALSAEAPLGLDAYMPVPLDNPLTPAKIQLGKRLFSERRLSRDGSISWESCHDPNLAFTDGRKVARGVGGAEGARNSPTLMNRGYGTAFFWDGRAGTLERQAIQPILDPKEMGLHEDDIVPTLRESGYEAEFAATFGRTIKVNDVARALASYMRTIRSGASRYDRHVIGEKGVFNAEEQRGFELFSSRANCWTCHTGPNLTDDAFRNTGVAFRNGRFMDEGRFAVTGDAADHGAFKTPTLRNIALTAPYMHDGSIRTLEEVIEYYDRGGNPNPRLSSAIRPLHLSAADKRALTAFLRTLTGGRSAAATGAREPSR